MKPIDTSTFERLLRTAFEENGERGQFVILSFGAQSRLELSEQARHQCPAPAEPACASPKTVLIVWGVNLECRELRRSYCPRTRFLV